MTVRNRSELTNGPVKSFPVGTTAIVAANTVNPPNTRYGVYRMMLSAGATAATFQLQDSGGNALSAVYNIGVNGFTFFETPANNEPLWQASVANPGLQAVVTGATVTGDVWYMQTP